jgi:outer membrane receptor protein involved in Fe transport
MSVAAALLLALFGAPAWASTTGKIAGRVVDKKDRRPLEGVNLLVPAARTGALTDAEGHYVIVNVPAGVYDVKVQLLGYRPTTVTGLEVSADNTTTLDVMLEQAPVEIEEIVVSAERPVVDLKLTSNVASVSRQQLKSLPVQELQDVVNLQAGVVDGHFRGGRIGEVQYQVDGVTVNNVYDNKSTLRIDRSLIEEVQVVSGTFDAEYGQAMSGVVNAVLRRGTDRFRWDAEVLNGGFLYQGGARRAVDYDFRPAAQQNYQLSVSGPTFVPKTYYLLSGRYYNNDDYLIAERRFTPWQVTDPDTNRKLPSPEYKANFPDGDGERGPVAYHREWSGITKLTNRSLENLEFNYQAVFNLIDTRRLEWAYRLDPDGLPKQRTVSVSHGVDVTHTLNPRTFYGVSFRQNWFDYRNMVYESVWDPRYDLAGAARTVAGTDYEFGAFTQGVDLVRDRQITDTYVLKGTFTSQYRRDQQLKLGAEFQWPFMKFGTPGTVVDVGDAVLRVVDGVVYYGGQPIARVNEAFFPGVRAYRPVSVGAFGQEELEWNDLRLRAGARLDYFNSKGGLPSDLANPANSIEGVPLSTFRAASRKVSLSPRIGVSYPVTRDAALFFAYGHFVQMPPLGDVFRNADYSVLADLQAGAADYGQVMGNPDIKPERTVQYQFGYKQALTEWLGLDATAFYKDIRDLLGVEFVETYNGAEYVRLTNVDFGSVVGFTVSLDQRRRGLLSTKIDYTWQVAEGNSSDPRETQTRAAAGQDPRPRQVPFNWDERHRLNATVTLSRDDDYTVSGIFRISSGQPYTPVREVGFGAGLETNSGRKPISLVADLRAEKQLNLGGAAASAFARVFNLFDTRFQNGFVFDTSGSPYYARDPARDRNRLADPTRYYGPRRVEIGITMRMGE